MKKIFPKSSIFIFAIFIAIQNFSCKNDSEHKNHSETNTKKEIYTCPMHPTVVSENMGVCPVCNMDLVKKVEEVEISEDTKTSLENVTISPSKQVLANVSTIAATNLKLQKEISSFGKIEVATTNLKKITSRFSGRIENLYSHFEGEKIDQGTPVADIFSLEIFALQKEFLIALNSLEETKNMEKDFSNSQRIYEALKEKLLFSGLTENQISNLENSKIPKEVITFYSPIDGTITKKNVEVQSYVNSGTEIFEVANLSNVWLNLNVFANDISHIKIGQIVEPTSEIYNEKFTGKIIFISPIIDEISNTLKARVEFKNPNEKLKIGMFLNCKIKVDLKEEIVVPFSSVISTGGKNIVWVEKEKNIFTSKIVEVGEKVGEHIQILNGIEENENVVISGGYLLDSESQLQTGSSHKNH